MTEHEVVEVKGPALSALIALQKPEVAALLEDICLLGREALHEGTNSLACSLLIDAFQTAAMASFASLILHTQAKELENHESLEAFEDEQGHVLRYALKMFSESQSLVEKKLLDSLVSYYKANRPKVIEAIAKRKDK